MARCRAPIRTASCADGGFDGGGGSHSGAWHIDYTLVSASGTATFTGVTETSGTCTATSASSFSVALKADQVGKSAGTIQWLPSDFTNPLAPTGYQGVATITAPIDESSLVLTGSRMCTGGNPVACSAPTTMSIGGAIVLGNLDPAGQKLLPVFTVDSTSSNVALKLQTPLSPITCMGNVKKLDPTGEVDPITLGELLADGNISLHVMKTVSLVQTDVTAGSVAVDLTVVVKKSGGHRP